MNHWKVQNAGTLKGAVKIFLALTVHLHIHNRVTLLSLKRGNFIHFQQTKDWFTVLSHRLWCRIYGYGTGPLTPQHGYHLEITEH